jgi:hypothetical protein
LEQVLAEGGREKNSHKLAAEKLQQSLRTHTSDSSTWFWKRPGRRQEPETLTWILMNSWSIQQTIHVKAFSEFIKDQVGAWREADKAMVGSN